ncbi:MAG: Na+/H+ antiporter NhaA [Saprospiraceae bacterium]|nr:Na+/H+ antiporter NhaA [Saprospiraceae bacterium]
MKFIREPFERFFQLEAASSIILFGATLAALILANSGLGEWYEQFWQQKLTVGLSDFRLSKSLLLWINDGLMALFFLLIGLEIKREIFVGELNQVRRAMLPVSAALGGIFVPLAVFLWLNGSSPGADGWGIPMATDIAFTLGILKLLGKRAPLGLKVFLTAYAIIDDLGAVLVIAVFYSSGIEWSLAGAGLSIIFFLAILGNRGIYSPYAFILLGFTSWVFFLKSGIHPTIAGVLLGFTVPLRRKIDLDEYRRQLSDAIVVLGKPGKDTSARLLNRQEVGAIDAVENATTEVQSPLQHLENQLHGWAAYFIIPLFALANAGVALSGDTPIAYGTLAVNLALSMVLGKALGIAFFSWLALRLRIADLPPAVNFQQILGVSFLGGLGFTMALFITNLAYFDPQIIHSAKVGILAASLIAGLSGYLIIRYSRSPNPDAKTASD